MKFIDTQSLLMPENFDEYQNKELSTKYKTGFDSKSLINHVVEDTRPPAPVKRFSKKECKALEEKMRKEGKL